MKSLETASSDKVRKMKKLTKKWRRSEGDTTPDMSRWVCGWILGWSFQLPAGGGLDARLTSEIWKQTEWGLCNRLTGRLICTVAYSRQTEVNASDWGQQRWIFFIFPLCFCEDVPVTDCLVCAALNEMCLPLIYSTRRVLSVCLLAWGINTIIGGQTHLVISQMLMDSLVFFQPSPTPLLSLSALHLISSICHPPPLPIIL